MRSDGRRERRSSHYQSPGPPPPGQRGARGRHTQRRHDRCPRLSPRQTYPEPNSTGRTARCSWASQTAGRSSSGMCPRLGGRRWARCAAGRASRPAGRGAEPPTSDAAVDASRRFQAIPRARLVTNPQDPGPSAYIPRVGFHRRSTVGRRRWARSACITRTAGALLNRRAMTSVTAGLAPTGWCPAGTAPFPAAGAADRSARRGRRGAARNLLRPGGRTTGRTAIPAEPTCRRTGWRRRRRNLAPPAGGRDIAFAPVRRAPSRRTPLPDRSLAPGRPGRQPTRAGARIGRCKSVATPPRLTVSSGVAWEFNSLCARADLPRQTRAQAEAKAP